MQAEVTPRLPITLLQDDEELCRVESELAASFDMFRVLTVPHYETALYFGFLEHLVRVTTSPSEYAAGLLLIPSHVRKLVAAAAAQRHVAVSKPFKYLQKRLELSVLTGLLKNELIARVYTLESGNLRSRIVLPSTCNEVPLIEVLTLKTKQVILYPSLMTYVDGFDPDSGHPRQPLITTRFINSARLSLVYDKVRYTTEPPPVAPPLIQSESEELFSLEQDALMRETLLTRETHESQQPAVLQWQCCRTGGCIIS